MWWIIVLSAMAYSLAFIFPLCGFLVVCGLCMLPYAWQLLHARKVSPITWCQAGFVWGAIALGLPLYWIIHFLLNHASLSLLTIAALYVFFVCCAALTSVAWWMAGRACARAIGAKNSAIVTGILYGMVYCYQYPLANPCIPLVQYRCCARLITMLGTLIYGSPEQKFLCNTHVFHCIPPINRCSSMQAREHADPYVVAGQVSRALACFSSLDTQNPHIVCAPESTFFYSLNRYEHICVQWQHTIKSDDVFMIGALYEQNNKQYQAVFCLTGLKEPSIEKNYFVTMRPIIQVYVKQHRLKLFEYIPSYIKKNKYLGSFFVRLLGKIATGKHVSNPQKLIMEKINYNSHQLTCLVKEFRLPNQLTIIPKICSEFFFNTHMTDLVDIRNRDATIFAVFVNDSWFCKPFAQWMCAYSKLYSLCTQCPMIYVGHESIYFWQ